MSLEESRIAWHSVSCSQASLASSPIRILSNHLSPDMMVQFIERKLFEKSTHHREALSRLEATGKEKPLSNRVVILDDTPQLKFMNTILQDIDTSAEDFIFYFDRLAALIVEQ